MESNLRKAGISMVALVITIIVLIVLTSAVVIIGVGTPKQAQLAVFYNNIDTVQDLVNIQMGNNMITAALEGKGENYKWVDIVDGCNNDNWSTNGVVTFEPLVIGLDKNVARISTTLLEKTSLSTSEIDKYYVDNNGVVYYEGFVYEGQTLYAKATMNGVASLVGITAEDIEETPISYYGAYVNYTQENGQPFKAEDGITDVQWRIFYAKEGNIYLTTNRPVEVRYWAWNNGNDGLLVLEDLKTNKETYENATYSEWARDAIEYEMFRESYNTIAEENEIEPHSLVGSKETGYYTYTADNNTIERLAGTLQADLYNYGSGDYGYWLASVSSEATTNVMFVDCANNKMYDCWYNVYNRRGIRPLVKLNSNVKLVESGVEDSRGYMTYNITIQ